MLALFLAVLAAAWLIEAADDNKLYNNFGTVAFIRSGERTPVLKYDDPILSALGAQQMYQLGQNFRSRYVTDTDGPKGMGVQNIAGMSADILKNDQVFIQTLDKSYLVSAAQAFMQGLYPPYSLNSTRNGPLADATGLLANGSAIDSPLGGYQYPKIQVLSELDPQSIYLAGAENCPESQLASGRYETTDQFLNTQTAEKSFYEALDTDWFGGDVMEYELDYRYAYEIYDYLSYEYTHNTSVLEKLSNDSTFDGVYDRLRLLQNQDAWYRYGNTSGSSSDKDMNAMSGQTLAALILGQFQKIVMHGGNETDGLAHPLTLLFGDHEPMVSFFSLAMIDYMTDNFHAVPPFASAMIFELFTLERDNAFPTNQDDLQVRFYFHNASEEFDGNSPTAFTMFGNAHNEISMSWTSFQDRMSRIMINQFSDWCDACSSGAFFCWGVDDTYNITVAKVQKYKVSPAVAGVIGAVVTLAVAGLLFAVAMLLGGIRFHRVSRGKKSELGGFKGSAKLASDADLNLPKNGAAPAGIVSFGNKTGDKKMGHERVGSWELRQKEFGKESGDVGDESHSRRASFEAIEAAFSKPVEPTDRV